MRRFRAYISGGRVSNALVIYLTLGDNIWKRVLIPHRYVTGMSCTKDFEIIFKGLSGMKVQGEANGF